MNSLLNQVRRALVATCMLFTVLPALSAEYASIAWSADGQHWGWARKSTQRLADESARQGCNRSAPLNDCQTASIKALVHVDGGGRAAFGSSSINLNDARTKALRACGLDECKVVREFTESGFISVARTKDKDSNAHFHVAFGYDDSDVADKDAIKGCEKSAKEPCHLSFSGAISGKMKSNSPSPGAVPQRAKAAPSCRPNTPTVGCRSQCTNGNCTVTYENGCKIRVQVQAKYDPFTKQWTYPAPSC